MRTLVERPNVVLYGDQALIGIDVRRATRFDQLLGPYSRAGFHHPGPALFYVLGPFVDLAGKAGAGLYLGASVVNMCALVGSVAVLWRASGPLVALWAAVALDVFCLCLGLGTLREPWNPYLVIAPLVLFTVLWAAGCAGSRPCAVWSLVIASCVLQTHIATAGVVVILAIVIGVERLRRKAARRCPSELIGWGALVVVWIAPVVELWTDDPNNLQRMWSYFTSGHPGAGWGRVMQIAGDAVSVLPLGNRDYATALHHRFVAAVVVVITAAALGALTVRIARRRSQSIATLLVEAGIVVAGLGTLSLNRSDGPVYLYFALWLSVAPLLIVLGLGTALLGGRSCELEGSASSRVVLALGIAGLAAGGWGLASDLGLPTPSHTIGSGPWPPADTATVEGRFRTVSDTALFDRAALAASAGSRVAVVTIGSSSVWPYAAGVVLYLDAHGVSTAVEPARWQLYFGANPQVGTDTPRLFIDLVDGSEKAVGHGAVISSVDGAFLAYQPPRS